MIFKSKHIIIVLLIFNLLELNAFDTPKNIFSINFNFGRVFPKYFFILDENQKEIISNNSIKNSNFLFEFDFNIKNTTFSIGRYKINRTHDIVYLVDNKNQIKTENHISWMTSLPISLSLPTYKSKYINVYSKLALIYAKRTDYIHSVNYYNTISNKDSLIYPNVRTEPYNIHTYSVAMGIKLEKNIYNNKVFAISEISYARQLSKINYKNGINRLLFTLGLSYNFFKE